MTNRTKNLILYVAVAQIVLIVGLLALPAVVGAIPGRYRVALQERLPFLSNITETIIREVAPGVTALPAPAETAVPVDIAALIATTPTATTPPTATATPTTAPITAVTSQPVQPPTATPSITPTPAPTSTPTPEPLPTRVVLEGLSVIRQSFNNCGPANLTQVLNFYGLSVTQEDVAAYLKPNPEDRNVSAWQVTDYIDNNTNGFVKATVHSNGTLDLLKQLVAAGFPVVIEKGYEPNTPNAPGWWGHYLTVYGYDDEKQEVYSLDTYLGPFDSDEGRVDSYADIEKYWQDFNYTFYVVYKPEDEETVQALLGDALLDYMTMWRDTAARAQAEIEADPTDVFAWFNLGEALTRLGRQAEGNNAEYYQAAVQAFDEARTIGLPPRMLWYQHQIYLAYTKVGRYQDVIDLTDTVLAEQGGRNVEETYWYRGIALEYLGDPTSAKEAYRAALEVNANFYPAQISLDALGG